MTRSQRLMSQAATMERTRKCRKFKIMREQNITYIPAHGNRVEYGWLKINDESVRVIDINSFDEQGAEQDTLTLKDGREFVTQDGGSTFWEN